MELKKHKNLALFLSSLKISAFTFGGGFVIVPLMREVFEKKYGWIQEDEMLDLTAIAQSSPGAIAVNASLLVGYKISGVKGAALSVLGTIIPPFIIISIISGFYLSFRDNVYVSYAMSGMSAGVAAVVLNVVISMAWDIIKKKKLLPILMLIASFVLLKFFNLNIALLILISVLIGIEEYIREKKKGAL